MVVGHRYFPAPECGPGAGDLPENLNPPFRTDGRDFVNRVSIELGRPGA